MSATEKRKFRLGLAIKRFFFLVLPIVIIVGAIGGTVAMGALKPEPEEKADTVEALPVVTALSFSEPVQLRVSSHGEVEARVEIDLAAEVGGRLTYVAPGFLPGGQFSKGEVLFRLDDREMKLQMVQADAMVAQARTSFVREASEADLAKVEAENLGVDVSDFALRGPQIAEAQAQLASAQAAMEEVELQLERTSIRAPFSGRVKTKLTDVGAFIAPGSQLGRVFATDVVDVPIPLTNKDLAALGLGIGFIETSDNLGPPVTLSATIADQHHTWAGRITRTESSFDAATRVLFAYVTVNDPYGAGADDETPLAPGLFVTADIEGRQLVEGVIVPRTALRGESSVYVARSDDSLEIRPVVLASSDRDRAVIVGGLSVGERVITSPVRGAVDGLKIRPVDQSSVSAGSGEALANSAVQLISE
ncbi:MAG: efflux RND transporter periplasmic adaptor subunit [Hyphomonadaceae bacterium]